MPFEQPFMGPTSWTSLASSQAPVQVSYQLWSVEEERRGREECGGGEEGQGGRRGGAGRGVEEERRGREECGGGAGRGVEGRRVCTGDKGCTRSCGLGKGFCFMTCVRALPPPMQVPRSTQPVSVMDWPSTDTQSTSTGSGLAEMLALMNTASKETTYWGYKDKFLALLDLEQKEHDHILTTRYV